MDWLLELWRQALGPWIEPLLGSVRAWQVTTLLVLTALVGIVVARRPLAGWVLGQDHLEHDRAVFAKVGAEFNEVRAQDVFTHQLLTQRCWHEDALRLGHFIDDLKLESNQFLDREVSKAPREMIEKLDEVDAFIRQHFFTHRVKLDLLQLYPELGQRAEEGDEEAAKKYWPLVNQLCTISNAAWESYKKFRATAKRRLHV